MAGNKRERELARLRALRKQQREEQRRKRRNQVAAAVVAVVAVLALVGGIALAVGGDDDTQDTASPAARTRPVAQPVAEGCEPTSGKAPAELSFTEYGDTVKPTKTSVHTIALTTNCGDIEIELAAKDAPETADALTFLADEGYYDSTDCHRLTDANIFVLQCGDPTSTGAGDPGFAIPDENLPKADESGTAVYRRGTVAMANSGPNTAGSQFFLVYKKSPLPPGYTVVGTMSEGLDVLDRVAEAGIQGDAADGRPKQTLEIFKAESATSRTVKK